MPRALWKGAISFGLVHVPVELYPAAQRHSLDLDWLDKRTLDPIGYRKINKSTGKEVKAEQIVKGYEYEKGKYVVLGEEDFKQANPAATQTVEILAFIGEDEVPAEYYDTPYYLAPGRRGEKVYALLREAMKTAKRHAIAHVVIQTKQHLALVYPQDRLLMLNTLRYADEIRDADALTVPAAGVKGGGVKANELKMALRLIDEMSAPWDPDKYRDTYREDILKRVKAKVKAGETKEVAEPTEEAAPKRTAEVIDLVALLRQSVKKGTGEKPQRARKTNRSKARRARRLARRKKGRRRWPVLPLPIPLSESSVSIVGRRRLGIPSEAGSHSGRKLCVVAGLDDAASVFLPGAGFDWTYPLSLGDDVFRYRAVMHAMGSNIGMQQRICGAALLAVALACLPGCASSHINGQPQNGSSQVSGQRPQVSSQASKPRQQATAPTSAPRQQAPSIATERLVESIRRSRDNQQLPFLVIDKVAASIAAFDARGRLLGVSPALLGAARGDHSVPGIGERPIAKILPHEKTTPAGRFVAEIGRNAQGEEIIWIDYDAAVSLHRVRATNPAERRLERLASPTSLDNRISFGCINVPVRYFDAVIKPLLKGGKAVAYVLPEVRSTQDVFAFVRDTPPTQVGNGDQNGNRARAARLVPISTAN